MLAHTQVEPLQWPPDWGQEQSSRFGTEVARSRCWCRRCGWPSGGARSGRPTGCWRSAREGVLPAAAQHEPLHETQERRRSGRARVMPGKATRDTHQKSPGLGKSRRAEATQSPRRWGWRPDAPRACRRSTGQPHPPSACSSRWPERSPTPSGRVQQDLLVPGRGLRHSAAEQWP